MVVNGMKYTILLGDPVMKGTDDGVEKLIYDLPVFKESEEDFKRLLGIRVRQVFDVMFGENVIDYKDSGLEIVRDEEGQYKYALLSFIVNGVKTEDLFKAVNPDGLYSPFNSVNNLFLYLLGDHYEDTAKSKYGLNGYAKVSDVFVRQTSTGKELGFHGLFAPIKEFSKRWEFGEMYDAVIMDWGSQTENMNKCIWPGFVYGLTIIMDCLFLELSIDYQDLDFVFIDTELFNSYRIANYRNIVGTADRIKIYPYLSPGRSFQSITPDIYVKQPVFASEQATVSGSGSALLNFTFESTYSKEDIEAGLESDDFIKGIVDYFETLDYQHLTWTLEDINFPEEDKQKVLDWYASNAEYLSTLDVRDFELHSYKIKEKDGKRIVTLSIKADIFFSDMPDGIINTAGLTTGIAISTLIGIIFLVVGATLGTYWFTHCPWLGTMTNFWSEVYKDTPDSLKWIWPLAIGVGAGWGLYLLLKLIFKKRR